MRSIATVILAAGSSSRLGQPKQLVMFEGEALLERAIRIALEAGANPLLVVLGGNREEIAARVDFSGATVLHNPDWREGMASSIQCGVRALQEGAPGVDGVLLMICDQPRVTSEHLSRMLDEFRKDQTAAIASVYLGKRGIPAIFPQDAFGELLALHGDKGARELLSHPHRKVTEIPLEGGELDIDEPEDLERMKSR